MKRICIYPGSFDPVTNGHMDIIKRSAAMFDELIVAVLKNNSKTPLFSSEERVNMLKEATKDLPNVVIDSYNGLLINYCKVFFQDILFHLHNRAFPKAQTYSFYSFQHPAD